MKFVLSLIILSITPVTLLYYLLNNQNFLPINNLGEYNWINIFTLLSLIAVSCASILTSVFYILLKTFRKGDSRRNIIVYSVKYSAILTIGLLTVLLLNFFHILTITWGISILVVVLIFSFII